MTACLCINSRVWHGAEAQLPGQKHGDKTLFMTAMNQCSTPIMSVMWNSSFKCGVLGSFFVFPFFPSALMMALLALLSVSGVSYRPCVQAGALGQGVFSPAHGVSRASSCLVALGSEWG